MKFNRFVFSLLSLYGMATVGLLGISNEYVARADHGHAIFLIIFALSYFGTSRLYYDLGKEDGSYARAEVINNLADNLDVSVPTIEAWVSGKRKPTPAAIELIKKGPGTLSPESLLIELRGLDAPSAVDRLAEAFQYIRAASLREARLTAQGYLAQSWGLGERETKALAAIRRLEESGDTTS